MTPDIQMFEIVHTKKQKEQKVVVYNSVSYPEDLQGKNILLEKMFHLNCYLTGQIFGTKAINSKLFILQVFPGLSKILAKI